MLWDVYGECRNYNVLSGHKNAVLEVQWTYDSAQVVSASADKTVGVWDAQVCCCSVCLTIPFRRARRADACDCVCSIDRSESEEVYRTHGGGEQLLSSHERTDAGGERE